MTTENYDEVRDPAEQRQGEEQRSDAEWAALRREKKANKDKDQEIANLRREAAFRDAGINPNADDALTKMFVKGYDGEATAEAIKAAALAVGFVDDAAPPPVDPVVDAAPDSAARIANAAAGGVTEVPEGTQALDEAYRTGGVEAMLRAATAQGITVTPESGSNY
jgi:hypothetical protein